MKYRYLFFGYLLKLLKASGVCGFSIAAVSMLFHLFRDWHFLNFSLSEIISHIIFIGFFIEMTIILLAVFFKNEICIKILNFQFESLHITKNE